MGREVGSAGTVMEMQEEIDDWLDNLPPFIPEHYYCKLELLREVRKIVV